LVWGLDLDLGAVEMEGKKGGLFGKGGRRNGREDIIYDNNAEEFFGIMSFTFNCFLDLT